VNDGREREVDLTDPTTFHHWVTDTVRFSDQDAVGHVNNVAVVAYVETGRVSHGYELVHDTVDGDEGFVLAHLGVDYRRESYFPGEVRIGSRVLRIGNASYTLGSGVFKDGVCIATARCVLVHRRGPATAPIGGRLRARLEELAAEPVGEEAALRPRREGRE
jgi:acyl-CoA thioester hydrolase